MAHHDTRMDLEHGLELPVLWLHMFVLSESEPPTTSQFTACLPQSGVSRGWLLDHPHQAEGPLLSQTTRRGGYPARTYLRTYDLV